MIRKSLRVNSHRVPEPAPAESTPHQRAEAPVDDHLHVIPCRGATTTRRSAPDRRRPTTARVPAEPKEQRVGPGARPGRSSAALRRRHLEGWPASKTEIGTTLRRSGYCRISRRPCGGRPLLSLAANAQRSTRPGATGRRFRSGLEVQCQLAQCLGVYTDREVGSDTGRLTNDAGVGRGAHVRRRLIGAAGPSTFEYGLPVSGARTSLSDAAGRVFLGRDGLSR